MTAIHYYNKIYKNDTGDVEALNGLGNCYLALDENDKSIHYFEEALHYLPGNVQQYFYLAKAYSFSGKLDDAIKVYEEINKIDETYSEAWAGIGKMYYWKGKPKTADFYYRKALKLDPENEELKTEHRQIQNELKFGLSLKSGPIQEIEESYEINAINTKVRLAKRINDHFYVEANYLLDYSNRVFTDNIADTTRWFNTTWIKGTWITPHHKVSAYGGYSTSDDLFSTYGLNWKLNYKIGKVSIKNSITAGYDYFYYWNKVGGKSISDNLGLSYGNLSFSAFYTYGIVDSVLVEDVNSELFGISDNPYNAYSFSLAYKILARPAIKIGINHSFLNYTYKSPLYYSPFDRKLTGASASIYYDYKKFYVYGSFSYNLGTEIYYEENSNGSGNGNNTRLQTVKMNVNNWSTNVELGYNLHPFSFSIGGSNFYNPFYQNLTGFIAIKVLL
jgi:tetratricopeptide (TPR) repeat protein